MTTFDKINEREIMIGWDSYADALAEGFRRDRDNDRCMNPAIQALLDGDEVAFRYGPDTSVMWSDDVIWECRNFNADDYWQDDFSECTDGELRSAALDWSRDPHVRRSIAREIEDEIQNQ